MIKRLLTWLFRSDKETAPNSPPKKSRLRSIFSGKPPKRIETKAERSQRRLNDYLLSLRGSLPRGITAEGVTFDSSESLAIKGNFSIGAQPNLSDTIIDFFALQSFIGHQLCAILAQHWLIGKACSMSPQDAMRNWFKIIGPEKEDIARMELEDKRFNIKQHAEELNTKCRIFGIRLAIFKVKSTDPDYYTNPFNIDNVAPGSYEGIVQVDPYWCSPMLDAPAAANPSSKHFYEPTWWTISGVRYHRTHLFIMREEQVADILKPSYIYGGIPLTQRIVERAYAAERTANEAPQLAMTKRSTIMKTDIEKMIAAGPEAFQRLELATQIQDNYGRIMIGPDDELNQVDTSLTDLDEVIMTQYQLVAAVAGVPATKLLGTSPKGFGASGDYEIESYHENLEGLQERTAPFIEQHHALVKKSISVVAPSSVEWNALDTPTGKELSEINLNKSQAAANYYNMGAIDGYDQRDVIRADETSGYHELPEAERPLAPVPGDNANAFAQP